MTDTYIIYARNAAQFETQYAAMIVALGVITSIDLIIKGNNRTEYIVFYTP